jgi:capsular exopolysaccharide synthesis family protein
MSIVDAIAKAKQLAQERQKTERRPTAPSRSERVSQGASGAASPVSSGIAPAPSVPRPGLRPTLVQVDTALCASNRLLVPGTPTALDGAAETAFRILRTRLLQRAKISGWTTVGITSASPDDGKTLTALNLALSLARDDNNSAVLLDLDMRNPSVYAALGVRAPHYLREYFEGQITADQMFVSIGVDNLALAGNESGTDRSSELLSSPRFEELVAHVRGAIDNPIVVVDLPPVLNTDDALVLAPRLDAILLVTSEGKTDRQDLQRAADLLAEFNFAGYVLNRSRQTVTGYGYY